MKLSEKLLIGIGFLLLLLKPHGYSNSILSFSNLLTYAFIFINSFISFAFLAHICSISYTEWLIIFILFTLLTFLYVVFSI